MHAAAFCPRCAAPLIDKIPDLDTRPRRVCPKCAFVVYVNPKIAAGTVPVRDGKVALIRRGIEPSRGMWSWPCGYLEIDETLEEGALRETLEEADARVAVEDLYAVISLPQINQVYMMFRARLLDLAFGPGSESLEVRLFDESEVPWEAIAFRTIARTLRNFFLDRRLGEFALHVSAIERRPPLTPELLAAG